jgi:hypothetical protein
LKFNPALVTYMDSLLDKAINSTVKHIRWQKNYQKTLS